MRRACQLISTQPISCSLASSSAFTSLRSRAGMCRSPQSVAPTEGAAGEFTEEQLADIPPPVELPAHARRNPFEVGSINPSDVGLTANPWGEASGRAEELRVGSIERSDFAVHVTESENLNVLGMNFLSTLERWGVEGRWLVLVP